MKWLNFKDLIGKKIVALRGIKGKGRCELKFILFDDKETILEFREQDAYDFHDCSYTAREMTMYADKSTLGKK